MRIVEKIVNSINIDSKYDKNYLISSLHKYELVSFDIYDTLVRRNIFSRNDLFRKIVENYNLTYSSNLDVNSFIEDRVIAESKAINELDGKTEVTINDIYNCFPMNYSELLQPLIQIEKDIEIDCCQPNKEIFEVFEWCIKKGKRVIICSDMYLDKETITRILDKCGYCGYEKIYLSSEEGFKKEDGGLYKVIKKDIGDLINKLVHIGDNLYSDYFMARKNGIAAIHISRTPCRSEFLQIKRIPENHKEVWKKINTIIMHNKSKEDELEYSYGYEILGPILFGFCQWIDTDARNNNISKLFFLSRDGGIIREAYNLLYEDKVINNDYLYASRRALFVPQIWMDNTVKNFSDQFRHNVKWNLRTFCNWMDIDYERVKTTWLDCGMQLEESITAGEMQLNPKFKDFYEKIKDYISENSKKEFNTYIRYLESMDFSGNVAIVDIGWKGRMQKNLNDITTKAGIDANIIGYYVGLYDQISDELCMKSYINNALEVVDCVGEIFEYLFTSTKEGSTKKICKNKEGFYPVLFDYEYDGKPEQTSLLLIQRGAIDFIKDVKRYWPPFELSGAVAIDGLKISGMYPTSKMISVFGNTSFGDKGYTMIMYKGLRKYFKSINSLVEDWSNSGWHIGFAKQLLKVPLPYYKICQLLKRVKK